MKIVFATNNEHKLSEIRQILGADYEVMSLADIGCHEDIPEDCDTLEMNAIGKAMYVFRHYGYSCFADDTGLEVDALNGEPGVYSARYAGGEGHNSEANMDKLLRKLGDSNNRKARFRTVIAFVSAANNDVLHDNTQINLFEGIVDGDIAKQRRGAEGFGYDPIFIPTGYAESFAQMGAEQKNTISHRARAVAKLVSFLYEKQL